MNQAAKTFTMIIFVLFSTVLPCTTSLAKGIPTKTRKPKAELFGGVSLSVLPTYKDISFSFFNTSNSNVTQGEFTSTVALLPTINLGLIRNYSDEWALLLLLDVGPRYAIVGSNGSLATGPYIHFNGMIGKEIVHGDKWYISFLLGVSAVYNSINGSSVNTNQSEFSSVTSLLNSMQAGAGGTIGLLSHYNITEKFAVRSIFTVTLGGYLFEINPTYKYHNSVQTSIGTTAFGVDPKISGMLIYNVTKDGYFYFGIDVNVPIFIITYNPTLTHLPGRVAVYPSVGAFIGFGYKF